MEIIYPPPNESIGLNTQGLPNSTEKQFFLRTNKITTLDFSTILKLIQKSIPPQFFIKSKPQENFKLSIYDSTLSQRPLHISGGPNLGYFIVEIEDVISKKIPREDTNSVSPLDELSMIVFENIHSFQISVSKSKEKEKIPSQYDLLKQTLQPFFTYFVEIDLLLHSKGDGKVFLLRLSKDGPVSQHNLDASDFALTYNRIYKIKNNFVRARDSFDSIFPIKNKDFIFFTAPEHNSQFLMACYFPLFYKTPLKRDIGPWHMKFENIKKIIANEISKIKSKQLIPTLFSQNSGLDFQTDDFLSFYYQGLSYFIFNEILNGVKHEITNPIQGIHFAMLSILEESTESDNKISPDTIEIVQAILKNTENIQHLIANFKDGLTSHDKLIDNIFFQATLKKVLRPLDGLLNIKGSIDASVNLKNARLYLIQILLNLAKNALNAYPSNSVKKIDIFYSLDQPRSILKVQIQDYGPGLTNEVLSSHFSPHSHYTYQGSGLGLMIVSQLIKKLEGYFYICTSSSGTTFLLNFPYE